VHPPTRKSLAPLVVAATLGLAVLPAWGAQAADTAAGGVTADTVVVVDTTSGAVDTTVVATDPPTTVATTDPATTVATDPPTTAPPTTAPPTTAPPTTAPPPTDPPTTTPPATTTPPTTAPATTAPPTTAPGVVTTVPGSPPNAPTTTAGSTAGPSPTSGGTGGSTGGPAAGSGPGASGGGTGGGTGGGRDPAVLARAGSLAVKAGTLVLGKAGTRALAKAGSFVLAKAKPVVERLLPKPVVHGVARAAPVAAAGQAASLVAGEMRELEPTTVARFLWLALAALLATLVACGSLWWTPGGWPTTRGLALTAHRHAPRPTWPPLAGTPPRPAPTTPVARRPGVDVLELRAAPPPSRPVFSDPTDAAGG
jgi:hypothetical protein